MTQWSPVWKIEINSVEYTDITLANLTISSGRTNIYEQAQAGYANVTLINLNQANVPIQINDSLSIQVKDSTGSFVPIFGGSVVDLGIEVSEAGSSAYTQSVTIIALGALARLPKALTNGVLAKAFDGTQILSILTDLLLNNWGEVPAALQWVTYDPSITWANAENTGLGEIDTPGDYELTSRTSSVTDMYSLISALATSGLGYIYENAYGQISYADSTHRSQYLAANGYTDISANDALAQGIKVITSAGNIRNSIVIKYKNGAEASAEDVDSIQTFGLLAQSIQTSIEGSVDAQFQADFYLTLRAYPQAMLNSITFALTNPEIDDLDRDSMINIFMGLPLRISDLPTNMVAGTFIGFVEGWTFSASYNELSVTALLSPISFSLQAMKWMDVSIAEQWQTISGSLEWQTATVVA